MGAIPEAVIRSLTGEDPLYVYDTQELRRACRRFNGLPWSPRKIHFATMANAHPTFLRIVREEGLGAFVNSPSHLEAALCAGYRADEIVFAASASSRSLLEHLGTLGVRVNLDSPLQVAAWSELFPGVSFGIRCNVGDAVMPRRTAGGYFVGRESRIGLLPEEVRALAGNPSVAGVHLYAGTNVLDVDYFLECYRALLTLARLFPNLEYLDLGGGFGVPNDTCCGPGDAAPGREFDLAAYGEAVRGLLCAFCGERGKPVSLVLEPGRIVGASCGFFCCTVTDIKIRNGRQLIGVDASSAQFPRPLFYPEEARHPACLLREELVVDGDSRASAVYGCSTYSRDYLGRDLMLPDARVGDRVVFGNAGAYCSASHTSFLGFPPPREVFV